MKRDANAFIRFDSPADFARAIKERGIEREADRVWACGTFDQAMAYLERGDVSKVPAAERLIERLTYSIPTIGPEWITSPAGAFPIIPDFISGRPDCMRRKVRLMADSKPIRIFVNLQSSAHIEPETLEKRGPVYLALALALARVRPVELYGVVASTTYGCGTKGGRATAIRVDPYNIAAACGLLACPAVARQTGYGWLISAQGVDRSIPSWRDADAIKRLIGCGPTDLYMHRLDEADRDGFLSSPERWVIDQVERHTRSIDDDARDLGAV